MMHPPYDRFRHLLSAALIAPIQFYRRVISPIDSPVVQVYADLFAIRY